LEPQDEVGLVCQIGTPIQHLFGGYKAKKEIKVTNCNLKKRANDNLKNAIDSDRF
jgi:hypothetical protein